MFFSPLKTYANQCVKSLGSNPQRSLEYKYLLTGPKSYTGFVNDPNLKPFSLSVASGQATATEQPVTISFHFHPSLNPSSCRGQSECDLWIGYKNGDDYANIKYKLTFFLQITADGETGFLDQLKFPTGNQPNIQVNKNIPKPAKGKQYKFEILAQYDPPSQSEIDSHSSYCETSGWFFAGEPDDGILTGSFEFPSDPQSVFIAGTSASPGENTKCQELKAKAESELCNAVRCMRQLQKGGDTYWNSNPPSDLGAMLYTASAGTWKPPVLDLKAEGDVKYAECGRYMKKYAEYAKELVEASECKDTVINQDGDCTFSGSGHQELSVSKPNDQGGVLWMADRLGVVQTALGDQETGDPYSSGDKCDASCSTISALDMPTKFICKAMCWISNVFAAIVQWGWELFKGAMSTESDTPYVPMSNPDFKVDLGDGSSTGGGSSGTGGSGSSGTSDGAGDRGSGSGTNPDRTGDVQTGSGLSLPDLIQ